MTPDEIEQLFTQSDGTYRFARWGRSLAPVVFGVQDDSLAVIKDAIAAIAALSGLEMAETDPELGANLMVFFFRDWRELPEVPNLDRLIEGLGPLVDRLHDQGATQYRVFRFDEAGAIRAAFVFLRMDSALSHRPAADLALGQMAKTILLWSDRAFANASPLGRTPGGAVVLKPGIAAVIRAAYDPVMPAASSDPSHALRLAARVGSAA